MTRILKPSNAKRIIFFLSLDFLISMLTLYSAYALRFNFQIPSEFLTNFWIVFFTLFSLKLLFFLRYNIYLSIWRFFGLSESKNIFKAHIFAYSIFFLIFISFHEYYEPFPRSVIIIDLILSLVFIGILRISKRMKIEQNINPYKPTLIIGVNPKTSSIIKSALNNEIPYYPVAVCLADYEEQSAKGTYINNLKVYSHMQLQETIGNYDIQAVIITADLPTSALKSLYDTLSNYGIKEIKKVKLLGEQYEKLQDLSIEDLLARHPKDLDNTLVESFIQNKSVLITGAGGSIGSEIALQCQKFGASSLTLLDNSEYNLYQIGEKLPDAKLKLISVTDYLKLEELFRSTSIDIVIHAAAYKHVPICEANIDIAIENNILGSKNVIDLAVKYSLSKVVIISTDKAVRPTNVMGTTKRVVELYAQNIDTKKSEIVCVRFGNVLGSSGSVIPKFKSQIENGGPITVTDERMTRYFMLIPEACQLVLQAASIAKGGELFILDMGEPVKIVDLASQMISLYGKEDEIEIEFCGLRPGEKLYEELLIDPSDEKTKFSSIMIAKSSHYPRKELQEEIYKLFTCKNKVAQLKKIVPEFNHKG
ncbi:MAG: nucleoside-diphosphate sugar epimerase/dehydratase [Campylobacterota bacterium]|nr:nucleoside-diphosphate sugar epimerase/dehydratase [Campylobacterota bacterium]